MMLRIVLAMMLLITAVSFILPPPSRTSTTHSQRGYYRNTLLAASDKEGDDLSSPSSGDDLMSSLLSEVASRLSTETTTALPSEVLFNKRSLAFSSPASVGGGRPNGPSPFLSPDAVVQHVLEGLKLGCYAPDGGNEEECDVNEYESSIRQCWLFAALSEDGGYNRNFRYSWEDGEKSVNEVEFGEIMRKGVLLPFGEDGGVGVGNFRLLGLPVFDKPDDDDTCLVKIEIERGERVGVYLFRVVRGGVGIPKYSHADCWLIQEIISC